MKLFALLGVMAVATALVAGIYFLITNLTMKGSDNGKDTRSRHWGR